MTTTRLTSAQVAAVLGVSQRTVGRMVLRGQLIPVHPVRGRGYAHEFDADTMRPPKTEGKERDG